MAALITLYHKNFFFNTGKIQKKKYLLDKPDKTISGILLFAIELDNVLLTVGD